jgi:ADP-ribose pyrophosphatase YjhB (NUDIX family)
MEPDLASFLARHRPQLQDSAVWGNGALHLRIIVYLGQEPPPLTYVTSVRGIVFRDGMVLVLRNRDALHIVPGGRRETDETLEETLRREVLEETGWTLHAPTMLGFMHFHHLSPKPPDYPYPHPDFMQIVYMARAAVYQPSARIVDDYEIESGFRPTAALHALALTPSERLFLANALAHEAM